MKTASRYGQVVLIVLAVAAVAWAWETRMHVKSPAQGERVGVTSRPVQAPTTPRPDVSFTSLDGTQTFRVPMPGDPEYADYLEMLRYPRFRSSLEGSPGYALPYDPEWRSVISGRREVAKRDVHLRMGTTTLDRFGFEVLAALQQADSQALFDLRIDQDEFGDVLWPEFPQSRPYLKIPLWEAWGFNHAKSLSGIRAALQQYGGRKLELVSIDYDSVHSFTNFQMLQDVSIRARDIDTQEVLDLDIIPAVILCGGRYKALNYAG